MRQAGLNGRQSRANQRFFNLHGLLKVSTNDMTPSLEQMWNAFYFEYSNHETVRPQEPDLHVTFGPYSPRDDGTVFLDDKHIVGSKYFACFGEAHNWASWRFDLEQLDEAVRLRVDFNPAGAYFINSAVIEPTISALATMKGWAFLHASGLVSSRGAVLLSGRGGSGKSSISLRMAARGHGYLADDRILLAAGRAYGIKSNLNIFNYNFSNLPSGSRTRGRQFSIAWRKVINLLSGGTVKIFMKVNPFELFPVQPSRARVVRVCILRSGSDVRWTTIGRETAIKQLILNEQLEHSLADEHFLTAEYTGYPEIYAGHWRRYGNALDRQLGANVTFETLEVPRTLDEEVDSEIEKGLRLA